MKETITIENFGGIKKAVIPLNSINIFIGKQASGKSVTAKLIYFFKRIFREIFTRVAEGNNKVQIDSSILSKFSEYFPPDCWLNESFYIQYKIDGESISLSKEKGKKLKIIYTPRIKKLFSVSRKLSKKRESLPDIFTGQKANKEYDSHLRDEFGDLVLNTQLFIPAGRSFFANLQSSIFYFLSNNKSIDPFLVEFGLFYEQLKPLFGNSAMFPMSKHLPIADIEKMFFQILGADYKREKNKDYLIHPDKREIDVSFSSSGQQEILPLAIILNSFTRISFSEDRGVTIYIEEPEAHLFPSAQKKIVELISTIRNVSVDELQFIITTHSPYILTSFNNLLQAGELLGNDADKKELFKIVPEFEVLKPGELNAFAFQDGGVKSLIDEETGLISADLLDEVSEEIAIQFDELLEL